MSFPPSHGAPMPPLGQVHPGFMAPPLMGAHPGLQPAPPGVLPMMHPLGMPVQRPVGQSGLMAPPVHLLTPQAHATHSITTPPVVMDGGNKKYPSVHVSMATMKVATTVFVGNISDKASDTLVRQILLRCGSIMGWKRVQDASGKLQAFGFCEYCDPEATLRALRLLHDRRLGDKSLVVKVDGKTRKDLLKYVTKKNKEKEGETVNEEDIEKEVAVIEGKADNGLSSLTEVVDDEMKADDDRINESISSLFKQHLDVLSSEKSSEDMQRERDVKESILFMAKQCGTVDPDSTLDEMEMEDDMKTLVSDEIKRFRQAYKRDESRIMERKKLDSSRDRDRDRDRDRERDRDRDRERETRERDGDKTKGKESKDKKPSRGESPPRERERERGRDRSSRKDRSKSPRAKSRSPHRRSRSPVRSRSQERAERDKKQHREREETAKEEEDYEERIRQRKQRSREKIYREHLAIWDSRERRKQKDYDRELANEEAKREEMDREKKNLADFLEEYDDSRDDQKYYHGNAYARRRREREVEIEEDERDRIREKQEIESLRLEVMERQAHKALSGSQRSSGSSYHSSDGEESPHRRTESDDDDMVGLKEEVTEDIPLTKTEFQTSTPAYPPIQVHSAPVVKSPLINEHLKESTDTTPFEFLPSKEEAIKKERKEVYSDETSPAQQDSPQMSKLAFGVRKSSKPLTSTSLASGGKKSKLDTIFSSEADEIELKPKRRIVPIDYSDEEEARENGSFKLEGKLNTGIALARGSIDKSVSTGGNPSSEKKLTIDERKKMVHNLVNSIPSSKEEVFQYILRWEQLDANLITKRVKPWINKKIMEYIGETEPVLTEFICNKLACHIPPGDILSDIAMVLDDEAEMFVVKLWRLLIYETEAKHLGIGKSY